MKINENLTTDLKTKMSTEFGKTGGGGTDKMMIQNGFINSLGENKGKNKKEQVIKRKIKKGVSDKIVGTPKLDKPIGKMYSSIGGESKESTGSGSAGGFEGGALFSMTKKEMDEMKQTSFKAPKLTMFSDEAPKSIKTMNESRWKGYKQNGMKDKNGKSSKNTNYEISEEIFESILKEFTEVIVMCTPWNKCLDDPEGKKPETKWFVGRLDYNEHVEDWFPYSQDSQSFKTKKDAENAFLEGIYSKEPLYEKWTQKYKKSIDCKNPKGFSQRAHCQGKVKKVETKESTGSSSSGSYESPAAWAKSTKKKDWRGKSKTQIPGGKFVQVKEKCKKFPYCNQGDIKALNIFEDKTFKKVVKNISEKHGISENVIKSILSYEYYNVK